MIQIKYYRPNRVQIVMSTKILNDMTACTWLDLENKLLTVK